VRVKSVETCRRKRSCHLARINECTLVEFTDTREHNNAALYVPQNRILFMTDYAWAFKRACVRVLRRFTAVSNERSGVHIFTQTAALQFENLSYEGKITDFIDCFKGEEEPKGRKGAMTGKKLDERKECGSNYFSLNFRWLFYWCNGKLHKKLTTASNVNAESHQYVWWCYSRLLRFASSINLMLIAG